MKKLLLGAMALLAFNAAIVLTQMSCGKDASAQTNVTPGQINKILYIKTVGLSVPGGIHSELWMCNYDGTGHVKIPVTMPANAGVIEARLSPDGKTIFFREQNYPKDADGDGNSIYKCSIDGTGLVKLFGSDQSDNIASLQGAY